MERLMAWALRHRVPVLLLTAVVSLLAAAWLPRLQIAISPQSLIIEGDPQQAFYAKALRTFGTDRITIVYLSDPNLFQPEKLDAIRSVIDAIELLPFVAKTRSLFNIPDLRVRDDEVLTDPFLSELPADPITANEIATRALRNPFIRHNLLSDNGRSMAINVYLKSETEGEFADPAFDEHVASEINDAILPLTGIIADARQIGLPYVRKAIADNVSREQFEIITAALSVLALSLLLVFRRYDVVIIPVITSALSILWLFGAMAALSVPMSILTAIVPMLLIIVGSTEDVHLIAECHQGQRDGLSLRRAIVRTIRRLGLAISLTFLTSYFGFLAIGANPITLVREFGLVASSGLAINFLLTAALVPILLDLLGRRSHISPAGRAGSWYEAIVERVTRWLLTVRGFVLLTATIVVAVLLYFAAGVQVNNDILAYLDKDSPIKQQVDDLRQRFGGLYTLQVVVDGHIDNAFERAAYLKELGKIQRYVAQAPDLDSSTSFADYMALMNSAVNETGIVELPEDDDVVRTLMLFVGPDDAAEYLSEDRSKASIVIRHGISDSKKLRRVLGDMQAFIDTNIDEDLDVTITGESVLTDNAVDYLIAGQLRSLLLVMATIFVVASLLFVTVKAGLIALVVNLVPIAALFALMAIVGIPLDSATSMIAALAVGIGVDHTMHFMVRYNLLAKGRATQLLAVTRTIHHEAKPIGGATIALAAGFATLAISSFPPVVYFGVLSACTMVFSFVATFVLTPVLLSYVRLNTLWEMLGTRVRHELMHGCDLFRDMSANQIRRVILHGRVMRFGDGEVIMQAGDQGRELFVLLDGRVMIDSGGGPGRITVGTVGAVFGVAALTCGKSRVATATVIDSAEVVALDWGRLRNLARFFPRSAYLLFRNLSMITGERLINQVVQEIPRLDVG
ncbi:MAG: MMPL family transporter [Chromatiaceae bacterium]|nr:MMPL family transporter [Chromatiaceae bacterium]